MGKRLFSIFLIICMLLGMLPAVSLTVGAATANGGIINELTTEKLNSVFGAGNYSYDSATNIIKLTNNINTSNSITVAVSCTLNLNNKTINRGLSALPTNGTGGSVIIVGESGEGKSPVTFAIDKGSGTIKGGFAVKGGGIYVQNGALLFPQYQITVSYNKATSGGGIYIADGSSFTIRNGRIMNNTATGDGGGVYAEDGAEIIFGGGSVSSNTSGGKGGGIQVSSGAKLVLNSASVSSNTSVGEGGGVNISTGSEFHVGGSCSVYSNKKGTVENNVYLPSGSNIIVDGTISGGSAGTVNLNLETYPTDETPITLVSECDNDCSFKFVVSGKNSGGSPLYGVYSDKNELTGKYSIKVITSSKTMPKFSLSLVPAETNTYDNGTSIIAGKKVIYDIMLTQTNNYSRTTESAMYAQGAIVYDSNLIFDSVISPNYGLVNNSETHTLYLNDLYLSSATLTKQIPKSIGQVVFITPDSSFIDTNGTDGKYRIADIQVMANLREQLGITLSSYQSMITDVVAAQSPLDVCQAEPVPVVIQWSDLVAVYDNTLKAPTVSVLPGTIANEDDVTVTVTPVKKSGSHTMTAVLGGADGGKYTAVNTTNTFTIQKAPVTFTVTNNSHEYDGAVKKATISAKSSYTDRFTYFTPLYKQGNTTVASPTEVGDYDIYAKINSSDCRHADGADAD